MHSDAHRRQLACSSTALPLALIKTQALKLPAIDGKHPEYRDNNCNDMK